ncbi:hypothetical protein [Actinoalloteichus fjordicus]|nr:hypothetical protein [Actinoalloteichus fjordicus]
MSSSTCERHHMRLDHQTATYLSYDGPHGGAAIPIALQAFAHYRSPAFADQINSPAARQLLWRHIGSEDEVPATGALRRELLADLNRLGAWPARPRKLVVANGAGNGAGNGVPPGEVALKVTGPLFKGTNLLTQAEGSDVLVAELRAALGKPKDIVTSDLPAIDGAPGGTLESFGILADVLNRYGAAEVFHRSVNFVPTLSALGFGDLDGAGDLFVDVSGLPMEESAFDDFVYSSMNTPHCVITEELATWVLDRL